ncbi:MAG: transglutaminase domain-containing protein [Oscillospiraceae bacterium]|nr:transglutaminase domain-containing protein [Oscillospiraceae bacterium]
MKRNLFLFICATAVLAAGVLIWGVLRQQEDTPELIFPMPEAESAESIVEPTENAVPTTENTVAPEESFASAGEITATIEENSDTLYTSHDPLHYFRVTFDGNTITVDGVYDGDKVTKAELDTLESVRPEQNGEHITAQFVTDSTAGSSKLEIYFDSGWHIPVHIVYDENGLPQPLITTALEHSARVLENPITIPHDSVMEYVAVSAAARSATLEYIRDISEQICKGLESDYDKARALAMWVSQNIYYDYVAYESEVTVETLSLTRTLELQRSVCGGYANLYAALCQAQGITCHVVKGTCIQGGGTFADGKHATPSHEWNVVILDGRHIWVDTLWNTDNAYDGEYYYGGQRYRYFDISDECMAINHRAERVEIRKFYE